MTRPLAAPVAACVAACVALLALVVGCATPNARAGDPTRPDVAVRRGGAPAWRGKATFGVRSARAGKAERVVSLPGLGEIQMGLGADATCRLVWSKDGLDALTLFTGASCPAPSDGRLCFDDARFTAPGEPTGASADSVVVDGCADENDLLWGKLDGAQPASVARPASFRQRCAKIPVKKGCALTYVKKRALTVESNDAGDDGFALAWDGDRWRACFLEKESGRYAVALEVEDACGGQRDVVLEGDSADLDD